MPQTVHVTFGTDVNCTQIAGNTYALNFVPANGTPPGNSGDFGSCRREKPSGIAFDAWWGTFTCGGAESFCIFLFCNGTHWTLTLVGGIATSISGSCADSQFTCSPLNIPFNGVTGAQPNVQGVGCASCNVAASAINATVTA
ncbi:MAG TPA: hypothetical protein VGH74_07550 [Planctomycetaceae bacterium]|jgi:hypothetical protein